MKGIRIGIIRTSVTIAMALVLILPCFAFGLLASDKYAATPPKTKIEQQTSQVPESDSQSNQSNTVEPSQTSGNSQPTEPAEPVERPQVGETKWTAVLGVGSGLQQIRLTGSTISSASTINIPSTLNGLPVVAIGELAFSNSNLVTGINIPASVERISKGAFSGCTGLMAINVNAGNLFFSSEDGVLFNVDKTELLAFPKGKVASTYTIPSTVNSIDKNAFDGKSITITNPTGVNRFFGGWYTDAGCTQAFVGNINTATTSLYVKWEEGYLITYYDCGQTFGTAFSGTHGQNAPTCFLSSENTSLVSPTRTGYTFAGWYDNYSGTGDAITTLTAGAYSANITLCAKWQLEIHSTLISGYYYFYVVLGEYPQSVVENSVILNALESYRLAETNKTGDTYTIGGSFDTTPVTYEEYIYDGSYEGYYGKKFVYVPNANVYNNAIDYTFNSTGTEIVDNNPYWFEVEPIKWYILDYTNTTGIYDGSMTDRQVVSELALTANVSYGEDGYSQIYGANWDSSNIRAWLNGSFYNQAFVDGDKTNIARHKTYFNAPSSCTTADVISGSYNVYDQVYLLSYYETNTYYSESNYYLQKTSRYCYSSDFAIVNYAVQVSGKCYWMLRTANAYSDNSSTFVCVVNAYGTSVTTSYRRSVRPQYNAIRPALQISLFAL